MREISLLIDDYEEICANIFLAGINNRESINIKELLELVGRSRKYGLEYGGELLEAIIAIYQKEAYAVENPTKVESIMKFFSYVETLKEEFERKIVFMILKNKKGELMKKILIFFICLWALMAEDPHKPLPAKYLIEKGYSSMDIYLEDWVELEKNEIRFRDPWDYGYKDDFEIYFRNMETEKEEHIGDIDIGAEILSVFFKDITLDGLREIFVLSRLRGKYKIYSYHIIYYMSFYYYEINEELDSYLNKKYEDYSGELNAEIIKKEIGTKLLVDYMPVYFNFEKKYYNGEKLAYLKSTPTGYEEVEDIKESDIYVKIYDENVFAILKKPMQVLS